MFNKVTQQNAAKQSDNKLQSKLSSQNQTSQTSVVSEQTENEKGLVGCAPHIDKKDQLQGITCFTETMILKMVAAYNKYHNKNLALPSTFKNNQFNMLQLFFDLMKDIVANSKSKECSATGKYINCLFDQEFIKTMSEEDQKIIYDYTFKPQGPKFSQDWLSNHEINNVMKQYEMKYNDFKFLGSIPVDYDQLNQDYWNFFQLPNFDEMLKQNNFDDKKYGVIFNLDKHYQPGSHWVALYFDVKDNIILFSDSAGQKPNKDIMQTINRVKASMLKKNGRPPTISTNTRKHQLKNTECGVYSINFITYMLKTKNNFQKYVRKRRPDELIMLQRRKYFNKK